MKLRGFTLIELMIVILIVAILAAVAVPLLTAQIEKAKWSEGKAGAGTIATALKAYIAEYSAAPTAGLWALPSDGGLGLNEADFTGKYFDSSHYSLTELGAYNPDAGAGEYAITYTINVAKPVDSWKYGPVTLDETGTFDGI